MKKVFLTSDIGAVTKIDGIKYSKELDNTNNFVEVLKNNINKEDKIIFFASDPDGFETTDMYSKLQFESFNKSGFNFKEYKVIDHRYTGNLKEEIDNSDIVFLSGGLTPLEMKFFEEINLRELLKDYEGVIIGQSAGSINLADDVICTPEGEYGVLTYKGLNKTNINIEPHFKLDNDNKELLEITKKYPLYAICDGSFILDNGIETIVYGEGYYLDKNGINKLCDNKEIINI